MEFAVWIASIALIVLQLLILRYVVNLERTGCACASNWRRDYIVAYLTVTILVAIVSFILLASTGKTKTVQIPMIPSLILFVLGWLYVIFVLQYVDKLRRDKCDCSESVFRVIMETMAIINALLIVVSLLISIMAVVVLIVKKSS
jgi:hypothetical protein